MDRNTMDKLAESLGIDKKTQAILDEGSDHPYTCRCPTCLQWWVAMGAANPGDGDDDFGPFTKEEVIEAGYKEEDQEKDGHEPATD